MGQGNRTGQDRTGQESKGKAILAKEESLGQSPDGVSHLQCAVARVERKRKKTKILSSKESEGCLGSLNPHMEF